MIPTEQCDTVGPIEELTTLRNDKLLRKTTMCRPLI